MIDLRSDTVTRPTDAMRAAMASAVVGDGVIDVDPTVEQLERETAELLGKPAAVFMPSGTMTNQIGIRLHCARGTEFICESDAHIYYYEQGAFAQLSGLVAQTIPGDHGVLRVAHLRGRNRTASDYAVQTTLLCLENTHNRWGGRVLPQQDVEAVCQWARSEGLACHMDGARLWNAAIASGLSLSQLAEPFDSISVCYSKGLGAPVGSALVGEESFIAAARRARKLFGGGMRQAGIIAAGALHAIRHHRERLVDDHRAAQQLAETVRQCSALSVRGGQVDTNILIVEIDPAWGTAQQMQQRLHQCGLNCFTFSGTSIRFVTHMDLGPQDIGEACRIVSQVANQSSSTHQTISAQQTISADQTSLASQTSG